MRLVLLSILAGCAGSGGDSSDPRTGTTTLPQTGTATGTGTTPVETDGTVALSCEATAHAQVFRCTAELSKPGELRLSWSAPGGVERGIDLASAGVHEALIWGLKPDTAHTVTATRGTASASIDVTAGSVPTALQDIGPTTGTGSFEQLLLPLHCDGEPAVAMVDRDGEVVWWTGYPPAFAGLAITGFHFTGTGTVAAHLGGYSIFEHALDGSELRRLNRGTDFVQPLHHDIFGTADGRLYALFAELVTVPEGDRVLDGVYIFDDAGEEATWHLADHVTTDPTFAGGTFWQASWPGADDYAHANGIFIDDAGDMLLSLRQLDEVMKVQINPDAPDFGSVRWRLVGTDRSPEVSDFALSADPLVTEYVGFAGQHNATWMADGRMTLFDNREDVPGNSRGMVLSLDEAGGTATIDAVYDLGVDCVSQGGSYELPSGNLVFTCATQAHRKVFEFAPGTPDPVWTFSMQCTGAYGLLSRAIPVSSSTPILKPGAP